MGPRRIALAGLAAALVLGGCTSTPHTRSGSVVDPPQDGVPAPGTVAVPGGWRAESYHHVQLRVPTTWVEGVSPMRDKACGVGPDPVAGAPATTPYVGRPVLGSTACAVRRPGLLAPPAGDAVWFASPLPLGTTGDAVTLAAGGQRVTVQAADHDVRDRIVASITAHAVDANGCRVTEHVASTWPREGLTGVRGLAVCLYDGHRLLWSQRRTAGDAATFWTAFTHGNTIRSWPQPATSFRQTIVLRVSGSDAQDGSSRTVDLAVRLDPARISSPSTSVTLQPAVVRPWASPGLRLYAVGPGGPVGRYFRPILG